MQLKLSHLYIFNLLLTFLIERTWPLDKNKTKIWGLFFFNFFFLIIGDFAQVLMQTASSTGVAAPTSLISRVRCVSEDSSYQEVLSNQRTVLNQSKTQVDLLNKPGKVLISSGNQKSVQ